MSKQLLKCGSRGTYKVLIFLKESDLSICILHIKNFIIKKSVKKQIHKKYKYAYTINVIPQFLGIK